MGGFLSGVSAPELLAALAIPAGAALAYHGGRYTGPIGAGLAGFGGLGLALGQRQYNQQQQAQLAQQTGSLAKIFTGTPQEKDANQFFGSPGVQQMGPTEAWKAWDERQNPKEQKGQWFKTPQGGFEFINDTSGAAIPPAGTLLNGKLAPHAGDTPYEKSPNQGLHVPNALDARAMQIGGTTDISQLATHPEWIAQAQREKQQYDEQQKLEGYRQERNIALETRPPAAPESMVPFSPADVTTDTSHISPSNPKGTGVMFRGSKSGKQVWVDEPGMAPKSDQPSKKAVPKAHFPKEMQDAYVISDVPDLPGAQYLTPKAEGETVPGYSKYNPFGPTATAKFYYQGQEIKPTTTKDGKKFYKLPDGRNWMPPT